MGAPWPDLVPHHRLASPWGALLGHSKNFFEQVMLGPEAAVGYFEQAGVRTFSKENGGVCSISMGVAPALFITSGRARAELMREGHMVLSDSWNTATRSSQVIVSQHPGVPSYDADRRWLESTLAAVLFAHGNLQRVARRLPQVFDEFDGRDLDLIDFLLIVLSDVESDIHGLLNLEQVRLRDLIWPDERLWDDFRHSMIVNDYLSEGRFHDKASDLRLQRTFHTLFPLLVRANFESIRDGGEDGAVQVWFRKHGIDFPRTRESLEQVLTDPRRKDGFRVQDNLAMDFGLTFVTGLFVNTVNGLSSVVCEIERNPHIKEAIVAELDALGEDLVSKPALLRKLPTLQTTILESLRYNPPVAVVGGMVAKAYDTTLHGRPIHIPKGTLFFADVESCNRDATVYPNAQHFDLANIRHLRAGSDTPVATFVHNEPLFATFGGGGRENPTHAGQTEPTRRCPGGSFSVVLQTLVLATLYATRDVRLSTPTPAPKPHGLTSRPLPMARIRIRDRNAAQHGAVTPAA